ncbi:MAG: SMI1/KNR4 family protein [Planctomycetaceae bacterium]
MRNLHLDTLRLFDSARRPLSEGKLKGASAEELDSLELRLGWRLPIGLRSWLSAVNGSLAGPGGFYGVKQSRKVLEIEDILARYSDWKAMRWLPIGGDGCGNHYVVSCSGAYGLTEAVMYIDTIVSTLKPAYFCASDAWRFADGILSIEVLGKRWPWDHEFLAELDPMLLSSPVAPT